MNSLQEEIKDLVKGTENEQVEFKAVLPPSKNVARNIAAFSNTNGGFIILGIIEKNGKTILKGLSGDFRANEITHKALDLLTPRPTVDYGYVVIERSRLFVGSWVNIVGLFILVDEFKRTMLIRARPSWTVVC